MERRVLLVVDDEVGPRESLKLVFQDEYDVLLATGGAEAIQLARQRPIDAAIIDLRMAGMNGIEVLRHLKEIDANTQALVLTAYGALDTAREALRLEACDYLTKPSDLTTLRAAVSRMIERRSLGEQACLNLKRLKGLESELGDMRNREELLQDRSDLYGGVLHDISKPLTVIVGTLSFLSRRLNSLGQLHGESLQEFRERLRSMNAQADNIISVVRRYLALLRHDHAEPSSTSVNQVLHDLDQLLSVYPKTRRDGVVFRLLPQDAQAQVNGTDLLQILLNLTLNALHASPPTNAVEVSACTPSPPLDPAPWRSSPFCRFLCPPDFSLTQPLLDLAVKDHGPGIPPDVLQAAFDRPVGPKPAGKHAGLGLRIVRRLVLLARGAIAVRTSPDSGTHVDLFFRRALPGVDAASAERAGQARRYTAGDGPAGSPRIVS